MVRLDKNKMKRDDTWKTGICYRSEDPHKWLITMGRQICCMVQSDWLELSATFWGSRVKLTNTYPFLTS